MQLLSYSYVRSGVFILVFLWQYRTLILLCLNWLPWVQKWWYSTRQAIVQSITDLLLTMLLSVYSYISFVLWFPIWLLLFWSRTRILLLLNCLCYGLHPFLYFNFTEWIWLPISLLLDSVGCMVLRAELSRKIPAHHHINSSYVHDKSFSPASIKPWILWWNLPCWISFA